MDTKTVLASLQKWGLLEPPALAYGSTLLISLAPFLILFAVRVENTPQHRNYLRIALSFASGGLLGDAFMHLIPHAMGGHSHGHEEHSHGHEDHHEHDHHHHHHEGGDHHHEHEHEHHHHEESGHSHVEQTYVGLYIVAGIVLFFLIEKLIHFVKGEGHGHSHSPVPQKKGKKAKVSDSEDSDTEELVSSNKRNKKNTNKVSKTRLVSGLLNLIADFLHNFTDGLAIGATFAAGKSMGLITALTIFAHEIPHEIGDYAILIQAGYRRRSAMGLQLVTAIGALIGTAVGLHYGTLEHATQLILPITAGGFIYIATVSVLPDLLEKTSSYLQSLAEFAAMFAGLGMMFWIALYE